MTRKFQTTILGTPESQASEKLFSELVDDLILVESRDHLNKRGASRKAKRVGILKNNKLTMNIKNMSDDQALAVLLLATTVMDGKIEESELGAVLVLFCTTTGKTPDQGGPIVLEMAEKVLKGGTDVMSGAIIQATEVVKRRYSRDKLIALVKAMMGISKSDGDISMPEAQWIGAVMTNLGITLDDLIQTSQSSSNSHTKALVSIIDQGLWLLTFNPLRAQLENIAEVMLHRARPKDDGNRPVRQKRQSSCMKRIFCGLENDSSEREFIQNGGIHAERFRKSFGGVVHFGDCKKDSLVSEPFLIWWR